MEIEDTLDVVLAAPAEEPLDSPETLLRVFARMVAVFQAAVLNATANRGDAHLGRQREMLLLHVDERPIAAGLSLGGADALARFRPALPELPVHAAKPWHRVKHSGGVDLERLDRIASGSVAPAEGRGPLSRLLSCPGPADLAKGGNNSHPRTNSAAPPAKMMRLCRSMMSPILYYSVVSVHGATVILSVAKDLASSPGTH